jgi:hypothetical protein
MIMKKYNVLIVVTLIVVLLSSCKKGYLEVKDSSTLNRQSYVKNLSTMQEYMKGIYLMLSTKYELSFYTAYPALISDELKISSNGVPLSIHNNWSQLADANTAGLETSMNTLWLDYYQIIRACNFVIEDIDKYASENTAKANGIKGEAYAIRALLHLKLLNIFAQHYTFTADGSHPGVPYITTSDISKPYSRQTVAEVYRNMIADLESAISLMPAKISDCRYMSGTSAHALLARIYLNKEDFIKAKTLAIELINQHPLMSINSGYPADMFKLKERPEQTEVLFQITPYNQDGLASEFLGIYLEYEYFLSTSDVATLIKENVNDIRRNWVDNSSGIWKVKKFPSGVAGGTAYDPSIDYYVPVIRSSELFLIAAEACAKTNDEVRARVYLNAIQKRADPSIIDITVGGQALLNLIYKERRKELCFEGFRMWDLQRWKQGVHRADVFLGYQTDLSYPSDKAIAPIPGQDVNLMGLQQNSGY